MRWLTAGVSVFACLMLTGCPSEFGKDGRIAKAVGRDAHEQIIIVRKCEDHERKKVCAPGRENSQECLACGGPP